VDLACSEAEVSDQKMVAEPTKAGWCDRHPPWCREVVTCNQLLDEISVLVENSDRSCTPLCADLVHPPRRRVGDENITAEISNFEGRESWGQFRVHEGVRPERDWIE